MGELLVVVKMVNKKIIIMLGMILLVSLITAQVLQTRTRDINLETVQKEKYAEYNITSPETSNISCSDGICSFRLYQERINQSTYNLGTHKFQKGNMTRNQIYAKIDNITDTFMDDYYKVILERENRTWTNEGGETQTTIKGRR